MGAEAFKDHFSSLAAQYATYRPVYPAKLAEYLSGLTNAPEAVAASSHASAERMAQKKIAWDAGCGSGQLSTLLGDRFEKVIATDASEAQLKEAKAHPHVEYRCARAETSGLEAHSINLATVAQAVHWFDLPAYHKEVKRVVKPGGVVALIAYGRTEAEEPLNSIIDDYYRRALANYWPPERAIVDQEYKTLSFPFTEITPEKFAIEADWDYHQLTGYFLSWSGTKALLRSKDAFEWEAFAQRLERAWGSKEQKHHLRWPIFMRVGRV